MTPFMFRILLHYFCCADDATEINAPIGPETVREVKEMGLLEDENRDEWFRRRYRLTAKGEAFVKEALNTPIPVQTWVFPGRTS